MMATLSAHNWAIVGGSVAILSGWIGVVISALRQHRDPADARCVLVAVAPPKIETRRR